VRRLSPLLLVALAALAAGCGNERQRAAQTPGAAPPSGKRTVELRRYGVTFVRPANWGMTDPQPPQIGAVTSGPVAVILWRYPREERLPVSSGELERARSALIAAARARDASLKVLRARVVRVDGVPGVELVATEKIGIARRQVRSTHLYAHGGELVVDAYAPPGEYAKVDRAVFGPLLRSLRLTRPAPRRSS
jgi:hypothetical protein